MEGPGELSSEAVLSFLAARGGRVRHAELVQHFQGALGGEAEQRARARAHFKELVNAVAKVRADPADGTKYVHLKRRFCEGAPPSASEAGVPPSSSSSSSIAAAAAAQKAPREERAESTETTPSQDCDGLGPAVVLGDPPSDGARTEEDSRPLQPAPDRGPAPGCSVDPEHPQTSSLEDPDAGSAPGGGPAPRSARQNLRDLLTMGGGGGGSSPQLKRSPNPAAAGCSPGNLSGGGRGKSGADSDTASVASSSAEDDSTGGGSVTLDPLEHAWMLSASDGKWDSLEELLTYEPGLLTKRDFITGFTCLHWAAKHGRQELLALLVNFASKHQLPVNINARTSGGYTALHLAAMHGHVEVVKLLVGAYDADVDIRDYSGKKASQYLSQSTAEEIKNLVGALEEEEEESAASSGSGRWRLSKVLPSHLITHRLSHVPEDGVDHHYHHHLADGWAGGKVKDPARKIAGSSSGRIRPRLNKIRFRTQIVHTTPSFKDLEQPLEEGDEEDLDRSLKGHSSAFKFRPKSNVFG
ncbi:ankyrin repeat domain-containing protein SOWAHC [Suncus etruscus]|uniref:ankyrin repeat domain-containing protein SOWAHC n=1 Tax=Suncus etruscus TaxID=109475 RepID=UPI0021105A52|nr:ankyrin repeat domain-containing protein SOWAHC [Suncus etruscus]